MWLGVVNCYSFIDNLWDRDIFGGYDRKNTYYYYYHIILLSMLLGGLSFYHMVYFID